MADVLSPDFGVKIDDDVSELEEVFGAPSEELRKAIHHSMDIALMAAYVEGYVAGADEGLEE